MSYKKLSCGQKWPLFLWYRLITLEGGLVRYISLFSEQFSHVGNTVSLIGGCDRGNTNSWGTNKWTLSTPTGNVQLRRRYLSSGRLKWMKKRGRQLYVNNGKQVLFPIFKRKHPPPPPPPPTPCADAAKDRRHLFVTPCTINFEKEKNSDPWQTLFHCTLNGGFCNGYIRTVLALFIASRKKLNV